MAITLGIFKTPQQIKEENKKYEDQLRQLQKSKEDEQRIKIETENRIKKEKITLERESRKNELYNMVKSFKDSSPLNVLHVQFTNNKDYIIPHSNIEINPDNKIIVSYLHTYIRHGVTLDFTEHKTYTLELLQHQINAIEVIECKPHYSTITINGINYAPTTSTPSEYTYNNKEILNTNISNLKYPHISVYLLQNKKD